jgi:hypothetical protein
LSELLPSFVRDIKLICCISASRIITLTAHSLIPIDIERLQEDVLQELEDLSARLRPTIIVCRGRPHVKAPAIWKEIFPTAEILVFSEDTRHHRLCDGERGLLRGGFALTQQQAIYEYKRIFEACCEAYADKVFTFRYRRHRAYRQLLPYLPGQQYHNLRAITPDEDKLEADILLFGPHASVDQAAEGYVGPPVLEQDGDDTNSRNTNCRAISSRIPASTMKFTSIPLFTSRTTSETSFYTRELAVERCYQRHITPCQTWWTTSPEAFSPTLSAASRSGSSISATARLRSKIVQP